MFEDPVSTTAQQALWIAVQLAAPPLVAMLAVGLLVSLLQALTQIQEATLAFLPKLAVMGAMLFILAPSMLHVLRGWSAQIFDRIIAVGGLP